jgi:hypothetical protein
VDNELYNSNSFNNIIHRVFLTKKRIANDCHWLHGAGVGQWLMDRRTIACQPMDFFLRLKTGVNKNKIDVCAAICFNALPVNLVLMPIIHSFFFESAQIFWPNGLWLRCLLVPLERNRLERFFED